MKMNERSAGLWLAVALLAGGVSLASAGCGGGSSNPTGAAGTSGHAGTTGGAGTSGAAGTTGAAGTSGAAGTTGGAGTSGAAGTTGGAGTSGAAGTTGGAGTGAAGTTGGAGTGAAGTGAAGTNVDGGAPDKPASGDGGAMTLTATLKMVDGGLVFPAASSAPMNQSPALEWSGAPAGTLSFAWTIKDLSANNVHFILYDIAPTTAMLAANLPRGAAGTGLTTNPAGAIWKSAFGGTPGYEGPGGGTTNNYELQLWALKVAKLDIGNMNLNQIYMTLLPMQKLDSAKVMARGTRGGL
jgi:phosphatidylethanolamine-binding protein (PEBP) family uncharacterized protein